MAKAKQPRQGVHKALAAFPDWVEHGLKPALANVSVLKSARPQGLRNPVLVFVVTRAADHTVEKSTLQVVQAWELLNSELKNQKRRTLGVSDKDFRHLKRIRNKLIAHRIENSVVSRRHERWYRRTYGGYEKILDLVARVAERVATKIESLTTAGALPRMAVTTRATKSISRADIDALFNALRTAGIY